MNAALQQAPTDDLLVAVASIAATLVAIIGGFLVSRVVALASERNGLAHRLTEVRDGLARARRDLERYDAERVASDLEDAVWACRYTLVSEAGQVDADQLVRELDPEDYQVGTAQLREALRNAAAETRRTFELLGDLAKGGNWPETWSDAYTALAPHQIVLPDEFVHDIYDEAVKLRKAAQRRTAGHLLGSYALDFPLTRHLSPSPQVVMPGPGRESLEARVSSAEADEALVQLALARVAAPPDLKAGLYLLLFFAAVSIVYPVALLARGNVYWGPWWRASVLGLFVLGLGGVLGYLRRVLSLGHDQEPGPLPDHRHTGTSGSE